LGFSKYDESDFLVKKLSGFSRKIDYFSSESKKNTLPKPRKSIGKKIVKSSVYPATLRVSRKNRIA
jgi:hypothetical protein